MTIYKRSQGWQDSNQGARSNETRMKAIVYRRYGSPEVLGLEEVEKPRPAGDEVVLRVYAASIYARMWIDREMKRRMGFE